MNLPEALYLSPDRLQIMQAQKLQVLLVYLSTHSPFYRELFAKHEVDITTIKTISDLSQLPTTCKEDLQQRNEDFLCVSPNKII